VKVILLYRLLHRPRWKCKALQLACLCVSPSVSMPPFMSQKFQISPNFLCMLPVTVAAGLFNGNSIRCLLPVLWMTSCFRIMGPMGQNQARRYVSLSSPDGGTGGEVWWLWLICFTFYFGSRPDRLTNFNDLYVIWWCVSAQGGTFWSRVITAYSGVKSPKTLVLTDECTLLSVTRKILKFAYYRNYCVDSNQILHVDKYHHVLFVGCPDTCITTPRWRI